MTPPETPPKEIDHEYTSEVVCPWCGAEDSDSWEYGNDSEQNHGSYDCYECRKIFFWERDLEVTYTTRKEK